MSLFPRCMSLPALLLTSAMAVAAPPPAPLVTILDGEATLLRNGGKLALAEGVRLQPGDLLATGPQTRLLRIEFPDRLSAALGPDSRAMLETGLSGDTAGATHAGVYLLAGWLKLSAPPAVTGGVRSTAVDGETTGGSFILALQPDGAQVFAESGAARLRPRAPGAAPQTLKPGAMLALASGGARPTLSQGAAPAFVAAMPRSFQDSLPARAAAFAGHDIAPRRLGDMSYADAQPWIDAEPALRRVFVRRWRALAANAPFRRGLVTGLKSHPEWTPILFPPVHDPKVVPGGAAAH